MTVLDVHSLKGRIKEGQMQLQYMTDRKRTVQLAWQKTGYGQRPFLVCPECGKRFTNLYATHNRLLCRKCAKVPAYWGIQNTTKGGYSEIQYRMNRYAAQNKMPFTYPFDYVDFALDGRIVEPSFRHKLKILQALENMRFQSIFQGVQFSPKTIRMVLKGEHPLILDPYITLNDLKEECYNWQ